MHLLGLSHRQWVKRAKVKEKSELRFLRTHISSTIKTIKALKLKRHRHRHANVLEQDMNHIEPCLIETTIL